MKGCFRLAALNNLICARVVKFSVPSISSSCRHLQVSAVPSGALDILTSELSNASIATSPDAKFEVLGGPYSLLSVSLSASQNLYTRRGTLIAVGGKAENAVSTLSFVKPFRRALLGIPFLYQRLSSASPVTALISADSSLAVVQMDGSIDWKVLGNALLGWTGKTISIEPTVSWGESLETLGTSEITGRGLLAIAGQGSIYQIILKAEESYVVHPSNVIAYTINSVPPSPFRLKSSSFRLQIPDLKLPDYFHKIKFFRVMQETWSWKTIRQLLYSLRTWSRRTIWGDRLFLQFQGPRTILLQTRASRLSDVLTRKDVNGIAETPPGAAQAVLEQIHDTQRSSDNPQKSNKSLGTDQFTQLNVASLDRDGKVKFEVVKGHDTPSV